VEEARRVVAEVGRVVTSGKVTAKIFNDDTSKTVGLGRRQQTRAHLRDHPFRED
jgi:hypothetical protein